MTTGTRRRPKVSATTVLVVDDHADTRLLYENVLRNAGYVVETAATGEEAITRAQKTSPTIVLMDLAMPTLDGWEAARALKAAPTTKAAWIVAITARSERHDIDRAYAAGCDSVALKPVEPKDLLHIVEAGIARVKSRSA